MDLLAKTLMVNAGSSAVTGAALVVGAIPLSTWLGIPTPVSLLVGAGLLLFALDVARTTRDPRRDRVVRVIVSDVAWVVGAAVVIIGFPGSMSTEGLWALGMVSSAVATYALLQSFGLRHGAVVNSADPERSG